MKKSSVTEFIDRMKSGEDVGFDRNAGAGRQRSMNEDGSYNLLRKSESWLGAFNPYQWTITTTWKKYWLVLLTFYVVMNIIFASIYYYLGVEQFDGIDYSQGFNFWLYCFFFSAQTFTTVGYGGIHPIGMSSSFVAALEAFVGLMTFAIATGTLYGRFSKPVSNLKYSKHILISSYKGYKAMQFMVANKMNTTLMEMSARVILSWIENEENAVRKFQEVKLEIDKIAMFPTNWVINHVISEESALFNKDINEIRQMEFEVFVLLKGFDDVFSQTIYNRHSYTADNFVWGAKFKRPFYVNKKGKLVLDLAMVGEYTPIDF